MKPWLRILGCALFGLFAVAAGRAAPSLSITGVSAAPASARPGDSVTYTVTVSNTATNTTTDNYLGGTANFTLSLTSTTATTISLGTSSATIPAIGAGASGTLQITSTIPLSTSQASSYFIRASMAGTTFASGATATATLNVASVAITSGGSGYTTTAPSVTFSSGTAAATASVSSGAVSAITLTSPGSAYTSVPTVTLGAVSGASGAAATASLGVDTITVTAGGTGYSSAPTVTITGGGGTGAVATATVSGAGVLTGITVTSPGSGYTTVPTVSIYPSGGSGTSSFTTTSTGITVIGSPDLAVTGLTYPAGTAYKGGDVIPMTLNYTNRSSTNGVTNVPYVPSTNGNSSFFRIEVILSANPIFGDSDDFLLTFFDISTNPLNADSANTQLSWNQLLPGNFAGSYYVMAKIDTLSGVSENVENDLTANGNNIYYSPDTNESRITLLPTNFPSVSWASSGGNSYSDNPSISGDGRFTAFASDSTTLGTGDTNGFRDIFLYDRQNATVRKVSLSQQGSQTNGASNNPAISANGTYVAFSTEASNLITTDTNGFSDIYVVNVLTGTLSRVSVATAGTQANGGSFKPAISSTGRYVAFESTATNLIAAGTAVGVTHVYLRDRDVSGSGTFDTAGNVSTVLISQSTGGTAGNGNSIQAAVSGDGGYVAFATDATNLGGTVTTNIRNIYLRSVASGTTTLVSTASGGGAAGGSSRAPAINQNTGVSTGTFADGRYIAFGSEASNLVAGDTNGMSDIFVYDRVTATTTRVSLSTANAQATDTSSTSQQLVGSINPTISSTGRYVAFSSLASNLTAGDNAGRSASTDSNGALDVFVRDRDVSGSGTFDTGGNVATSLASLNRFGYQTLNVSGTATTAASDVYPAISGDGRWVAFPTDSEGTSGLNHGATNRTSSDSNTFRDIFVYDRRINTLPSAGSPPTVSITSPVTGTSYDVNSTLTLVASASATSGTIASVQFFVNGTSLGTDTTFPYNASWTPTAVGTFALSALVTDSFGNQTVSNNVNITIAAVSPTAPTVSISSPAAGTSLFASGATTVSATASDADGTIASVQFFANGVSIGTDSTFPYSVSWTPTATGSYTLTAVATDNGGNQITTTGAGSVTVTVANLTAPSVSISSPTTGSTVQVNAATSITASASSNGSVASVQFLANGTTLATVTSAPFTFAWTPTVAGSYTLTAIATDNLGSQTTSAGSTVTVSAGASPTVSIASPAAGTINVNTPQTIVATAADSDGAIASVSFRVNGTTVGIATAFPYQTTWTPTTTGTFTLQAVASDNLGNQTTSAAVSMTVTSGTAPTVSITSPAVSTAIALGSTSTVSANVTANSGLIASVQFFANGIQLAGSDATSPTPPYTASFTPTVPGAYALTAVAVDTLGNRTTSSPVNVTVAANQSPSVNVSVASTATFGTATTISATASDSDGTITSVQFFDNGVSLGIDTTSPYSVSWTPNLIGSHNITAVATDNLGAKTTSLVAGVTVVGSTAPTPPTVSITAPGGATTVPINSTQFITATATANAPFATISSVQFFVSDGAVTTPIGSATSFPYSATWGPGSASVLGTRAAGTYTLFAVATDTAGNVATSASVSISVAAATAGTPTIAVVAPIDSTTVTVNQPVYLVANATDPDGSVALVEFTVNGIVVGSKATSPYFTAWTPPTAGAYAITATVTDNDGNRVTSSTVNITAAAATGSVQVAALTFNNPALDATSAVADPNLAVRVSLGSKLIVAAGAVDAGGSIASVQFFANGTSLATDASSPFYTTYTLSTLGNVVLTGLVTDSSGNKIYTFPLFISSQPSVSATNAVVKLVSPANGATYVAGQQIVFEATHNFGTDTPPKIDFYLNGFPATTVSAAPYQFIRFLTRAGTYDVQAVIRSGTETTYSSVASITVNSNTAPTVSITSPADLSSATIGTPINLAANATDSDGTISSVQFFANGVAISTDTTFPYAATFTPAAPGTYVLTALATDNSGEQTMSSGVTVSVTSGTAPTVSVTAPGQLAAGSSATISATATAGASSGTIASVQFFANGLSIGSDTTFPYSISFSPAATGTYAITAVATDTLGNQATSTASNVVVAANVAPTAVAITSGSASFALGATSNLTATATDSDGSIASVRFLIDGVTLGTATTSPYTMAWTPTTAGTYAQTVIATDNLGATTTSAAVNVTVTAGNSPTITITSPTNGGALAVNAPATISATASGATTALTIASVQFFANGVSLGTDTVFPYTAPFLPTAIGSYTLKAVATDSSGNQASTSVTVTVQANAAPSGVAITSPAAGATPGVGVATTITATATDTDGTIASVQFFANGTVIGTATSSPYSASWTPTINGTYALKVVATDNLGATTTSPTVSVTAGASNAPSGNVTSPLSGATIAIGSTTTITANAGANASGATVANVQFLDNSVAIGSDTSFPYTASWTPLATGTHSLQVLVTDTLGNQFISSAVSVTVAVNSAPTGVAITAPAAGATPGVGVATTVTATATDSDGAIASVQFFAGTTLIGTKTSSPYSITWTPTSASSGPVALTAVATDNLGATTTSAAVSVTVAGGNAPTVTISSPTAGSSVQVNSNNTITATASAATGTIASVQFFVNGTSLGTDTTFPYSATWTPTTNGSYSITAVATDTAGNSTSTAVAVTAITGAAPTVSIVNPNTGGSYLASKGISFDAVASDTDGTIAQVEFIANGVVIAADASSPYSTTWTPVSAGTYTLIARATDNTGNRTDSTAITITVTQNTPPTISLVSPAAGSTFTLGSGVVFFASAVDTNGTVNNVRFLANGDLIGAPATAAPFTTVWTPATTGSYSILAVGVDNDLNATTGAPRTVNIVAAVGNPPTVVLTTPASGASLTTASSIPLNAAAADSDGTIASVAFYDNGALLSTDSTAPFGVTWAPTTAGAHRLYAVATDNSGNVVTSVPVDVNVTVASSSAPTVSLTNPGAQAVGVPTTLLATATDSDGIVSSVQFFDDGLLIPSAVTAAPFSLSWTPTRSGTHLLTAIAVDNTGNQVVSSSVSVVVSVGAAPTVTITAPGAGASVPVNGARLITATATATTGTIANVRFFANGVLVGSDTAFPYEATWTPVALGTYSLVAIATDSVGNQASSPSISVTVAANAPPSVSITSPAAGSLGVGVSATVTAAASDTDGLIASVQFFANGVALGAAKTAAPYTATFSSSIAGTFNLTAVATDNLGATTTSAVVAMNVTGGNAPLASITAPLTGTTVANGSANTITATATSVLAGSTIASVQFFANGVSIGTDTTFPYSVVWTPVANGTYAITVVATDTSGNQGSSSSVNVTVAANTSPTVSITAPLAAAALPIGSATTIAASASDADGSVVSVQFFVATNGGAAVALSTDTTSPFTATFTPTTAASYTLTAVATDNLGATTTSAPITVTTSAGVAPTVSVTSPVAAASIPVNSTTSITANATATTGTIASVQFFANGVSLGVDNTVPYAVSWTPTANGSYSITAVATDTAGNTTTSTAVAVTVASNAAPTVSVTAPAGGATVGVGAATTVTANAADTDGTIASVQFFVANGTGAPVSIGTDLTAPYSVSWTPTVAGAYVLTAVATDNLGATTTSANVAVTVAGGNAPTVTITAPTAGSAVAANAAQTITANAAAVGTGNTIASVQFFANGVSLGSDTTFPYAATWTPTATGTYSLTAIATDTSGNQTVSSAVSVTVQANASPTVSVTVPATLGVGVAGTLTATAADADGTIASVRFFANGTAIGVPITAAPFTMSFTSNIAGSIQITATATDNLGSTTTSSPQTIAVSGGNAPTVALTAPATGSTVPVNVAQSVTATATAVGGTISSVEFRVVTGGITTSLGTDTTFPYSAQWTPTAVGSYTLTATATDSNGNQAVASSVITVTATSNAGPSVSIVSPANAATFSAGTPVVLFASGSDSNGSLVSVRFLVNGQVIGNPITSLPYSTTWTPTAAGTYSLTAIAVDNDFNATTSTAVSVTVTAPSGVLPTVTITSPSSGTQLTTVSTVPVSAGVSSLAVTSVQFFDNGVLLGTDGTAPFSINWSPTTPGVHRLVAVATAGTNIVSSDPVDFTVKAAISPNPPTVSLTSPTNGALVAIGTTPPATVSLSATASDSQDGTVARVEFFVNGVLAGTATAFPYTVSFTPTSIGSYTVFALATDNTGNVNTSSAATFTTVASGAPVVSITSPASGVSVPVNVARTIDATVTANSGRTITSVQFYAGAILIGTDTTFPYSVTWTPASTGSVVLTAVATDDLAVPGTSPGVNVTVSPGVPPSGAITSPTNASNLTVGVAATLTATATATLPATVQSVDFRVNGVSVGTDTTFPYSVTYTPNSIGTGFQIVAVITDSQSNVFTTSAVTVNVISAPGPTVAVSGPAAGSSIVIGTPTSVTATATAQATGTTITGVQFFANGASIGTSTTSPYSVTWLPTTGGASSITAVATDSNGTSTTSTAVNVNVTTPPPTVTVTGPAGGSVLPVNVPQTITATATTTTGTIVRVEFLANGVSLGTSDSVFPFSAPWTPVTPGIYALTARATDNFGTVSTSPIVTVTVSGGNAPTVSITSPTTGSSFGVGSTIAITGSATAAIGTIRQVEFFANNVSVGSADTTFPYAATFTPVATGSYSLTAIATDTLGNQTVSAPVTISVAANTPPTVAITGPATGTVVQIGTTPPTVVTITASASDADGTIANVQFFANGVSIGTDADFPYSVSFTPTATGTYDIIAVATDNRGGVTTSSTVKITAVPPGAPTVSITGPVAGAGILNNTLQVVTATASALSGRSISSVTFFANTTQIGTPVTSSPFQVNWTPTVAATYTLTAVATDSVGISTTSAGVAVNVTIAAPPIVSLTSPASGSTISANSTQTLTAAATAQGAATISQVQFFVNGVAQGAPDTTVPYVGTWTPTAVGTYSIFARATDSFGTIVDSSPRTVTVTPAPGPTVSITSPSSGGVGFLGIAQSVSATAIASGAANIASVQFFASNGSSVVSLGTDTVAPFGVTWTPIAGGTFVITAVATDTNGTQATSPGVTVTVNTGSVPTVSVTSPAGGATLPVNVPRVITADAASSTGNIASVQFFVNGVSVGSDTTFPFSAPWTPLTPGIYSLTATATDNLGNVTNSSVVSVTVTGGNAPSVAISNPAGGSTVTAGTVQTVVVNAVAANGTIASVDLLADGVVVSSDTTFPYNFAWTPGGLGVVSLTAVAVDTQGNRAVSSAISVTVAGISAGAPTVAIAAPTAGASLPVGVPALISAIANDADGTIAQVEFFANGASLGIDSVFPYNFSFTPGATGTYVITARATDNGGNIATSSAVSVTVSGGTAPSVAITSPIDATVLGVNIPQTITASANSSTGFITSVQFFLNGAPLVTDTTFPYSAPWTPGAVGNYTLTARATDNLGNITDSAVVTVTVGASAAPTVSLTNPANGTSFTVGTPLTVAADAADSDGSIAQVQFFVNGAPLGSPDTVSPYSTVWTANSVGVYALTAQATDNNGNISTSKPITVTIGANAAPTVALTSPVAGSYSLGNLVLVSANANDSDGSIATVQFFANGLAIGTATAAPYSVSWRPSLAGTFSLTAQATDNVGNVTVTTPVSVTITSTAAPVVTITNPVVGTAYGVGNAIPFAATPSGGNGPIAQVQFFVNGTSLGAADTTAPYSATWTPGAPGTYQLLAIATDSAGLSSSTSAVLNIAISGNNAPTVALTSPPSGTSVNGGATVNLTAIAADSDGTIASVRFIANGNVVGTATAIPYSTAWVPSAAGSYTVTAQATDNSGNVTNSAPITVSVVANRPPTVNVTAPGNGATVRVGAGVNLTATANDSDGTIASVQFFANGLAIGSADTTAPYSAVWTPGAEGIYRITATALDNSGAATVSSQVTVLAIIPGANGSDIAYSGGYQGAGESGRFAAINVRGTNATFIAFSNAAPSRIYFFSGLPVDTNGGFASFDTVGRSLISGTASDTGATGTMDAGRVTFIGSVSFGTGSGIASGYYTGSITGRPESTFAAIVGPDGTITIFASDGTFRDAGSATVAANGNFTVTTLSGTRFAGRADPATGFITGGITGGPGGGFTAAISSGVSFSDGFLKNLSTRGQVGSGSNILIAGFIVAGDTPKQVLIRAIGPSLTAFGVTGALADPQLQLFNGNSLVATNDNWGGASEISTAANLVGAFPLSPASLDSVIYTTLPPGSYTAQVSGVGGRTGVALVELYDTDTLQPFSAQKVTNVATRGVVGSGQSQLIAGFVVSGNTSKKVLIRAVGPTLGAAPFNVAGVLADPILRLQRSDELVIRENDNWETGNDAALITEASAKVGAFPLARGAKDAAILINLPPGSYSAQVTGPGTTTGVALVEVYEVP